MKLYQFGPSPYAAKVRLALAEKGIEVETQEVDVPAGDTAKDDFRKISVSHKIPCLVVGEGTQISESEVILQYLDDLKPEPPLYSSDIVKRAKIRSLSAAITNNMIPAAIDVYYHTQFLPEDERSQEVLDRSREEFEHYLDRMDEELAGKDFLGEGYSAADITLTVALNFWRNLLNRDLGNRANLTAFWTRVSERPSFQALAV